MLLLLLTILNLILPDFLLRYFERFCPTSSVLVKLFFSQMDSEREHATSTRGFHSGCRKMEEP